jgi:hypothetical protein
MFMDTVFNALTRLALSPFQSSAASAEPEAALRALGLGDADVALALRLPDSELEAAANGVWDSCDTCLDPGSDGDVEPP